MTLKLLRRTLTLLVLVAIGGLIYWHALDGERVAARAVADDGSNSLTLLSQAQTIDKIYLSMHGPRSEHAAIPLLETRSTELVWLTGVQSELVDFRGTNVISPEFFCHSNLTLTKPDRDQERTKDITACGEGRLFTLVPGRLSIRLPDGFGVPVFGDETLNYFSMALNLNPQPEPLTTRFRTHVQFLTDASAKRPMKALFRRAVYGYEPIGQPSTHTMCMGGDDQSGAACGPLIGQTASNAFQQSLGKANTIHWMIPPGKYESRVDVTEQLDLPFDTTVHYVTGHLHPFGKSIELLDKATGQVVFAITSKDWPDKRGVAHIGEWSSTTGTWLQKGRKYELVTKYQNTTGQPIDAMSILYLYALDQKFGRNAQRPAEATVLAQ